MTAQERTLGRRTFSGIVVLGLMALLAACSSHDREQSSAAQVTPAVQQASVVDGMPTVVIRAKRDHESDNILRIASNTTLPAS